MLGGLAQRRAHQSAVVQTVQTPTFAPQPTSAVLPNDYDRIVDGLFIGNEAAARNAGTAEKRTAERPILPGGVRGPGGLGVFTAEIDPVNYTTAEPGELRRILAQTGVESHLVSYIMGERHFRAEEYGEAIAEYSRAIALKADFAEAFFSRGRARHERGDLDRAIADYTDAIRLTGGSAAAWNCRGCAWAQKGEAERAIQDYTRAIALKEDYGDAWFNRGYSWREQGEYDRAIADFSALIELEPENASVYNQRGTAWYYKGEDEKAIGDFSKAISLKHDFSLAWYNRGTAWRSLGDAARAETDLAQARRLGFAPGGSP
jgi:tetratricopeptide (TPR) repeat protein